MYNSVPIRSLDEITAAQPAWKQLHSKNPKAINTTIGVLMHEHEIFRPAILKDSIIAAQQESAENSMYGYLPPTGDTEFLQQIAQLVFGQHSNAWPQTQSLGGTGGLTMVAALLKSAWLSKEILIDQGWANYPNIFNDFNIHGYARIIDGAIGYDHASYIQHLTAIENESIILLQTAGYNGDGFDRSFEEWAEVLQICVEKKHFVIFDAAYLGLADGFVKDVRVIQHAIEANIPMICVVSCSKLFGLYAERIGAVYAVNIDQQHEESWQSLLQRIARRNHSNTPRLHARSVVLALQKKSELMQEIEDVRQNVLMHNRQELVEVFDDCAENIGNTRGLFVTISATGFSKNALDFLLEKSIFCVPSSRVNLGSIHKNDMTFVAQSLRQAVSL